MLDISGELPLSAEVTHTLSSLWESHTVIQQKDFYLEGVGVRGLMHQACPPLCQATLKKQGGQQRRVKVDPLLFPGYGNKSGCNLPVV